MRLIEVIEAINDSILLELNFNDATLIKRIMNADISCGFEAEIVWPDIGGVSLDDINYVEDLQDHLHYRDYNKIKSSYYEWLIDTEEYMDNHQTLLDKAADEYKEDDDVREEFLHYHSVEDEDVKEHSKEFLDNLRKQGSTTEFYKDWDIDDWKNHYIENELSDEFHDYVLDRVMGEEDVHEEVMDLTERDIGMDDWVNREHGGNIGRLLLDHDVYDLVSGTDEGVERVAEYIESWASENSQFSRVDYGDYHSGAGNTSQNYWRVEDDSSIESDGPDAGAEIISPVYSSPEEMMREMESLFDYFDEMNIETNRSTGLHVTMSMTNKQDTGLNKLKVAVLLGDQYLLSLFDRKNNTFTRSQTTTIQRHIRSAIANSRADEKYKSIEELENLLASGVSGEKFSSANFKYDMKNKEGNALVEFRIAGGNDYHTKLNEIERSVIRYATVLEAGYNPDFYRKDYINGLIKLFSKAIDIDVGEDADNIASSDAKNFLETVRELTPIYSQDYILSTTKQAILDRQYWINNIPHESETDDLEVDMLNAKKRFALVIAELAKYSASDQLRSQITARRAYSLRKAFKLFDSSPEDVVNIAQSTPLSDLSTNDFINGLKKLLGMKESTELAYESKVLNVDPSEHALYVDSRIVENPTDSSRINKGDFRVVSADVPAILKRAEENPTEENQEAASEARRKYKLPTDSFVHVPWNTPYLMDLFEVWAERGVHVVPE